MTSGGSFHLCEDRKPSWRKPSPEIVFLCHSATSLWLYILPEPGPQPCHIPMLPALQAREGHPPCRATPTSDVIMAAHLSLWRDGGQWHSTKVTWKLNFYSWSQKSSSRLKAWGKEALRELFSKQRQWREFDAGCPPLFFVLELWKGTGLIPLQEEGPCQGREASDTPKETNSRYSDNSLELKLGVCIKFMCPVYGVANGASQGSVPREGHTQW